jgi:anti-anti-sigma factor
MEHILYGFYEAVYAQAPGSAKIIHQESAMTTAHKVTFEYIEEIPILIIEGDVTSEADAEIMRVFGKLRDKYHPKHLIINFEKTSYINSAGIATLINIIQNINEVGGKVSFVGLTGHFQKVMDIVGISDFVNSFGSDYEAIAEIKAPKQS